MKEFLDYWFNEEELIVVAVTQPLSHPLQNNVSP